MILIAKLLVIIPHISKTDIAVTDLSFKHPVCSQYLCEVSKTLAEAIAELTFSVLFLQK